MRKYGRQDANHHEIADAFRKLGCSFLSMSALGDGAPDGLVGWGGICIPIEIKDGNKPPSARKLTDAQEEFHQKWTGGMRLVDGMEAVLETVALLKRWHARLSS